MFFLLRIERGHQSLLVFLGSGGRGFFKSFFCCTWNRQYGTIYFLEDPIVAFSWILCQNPEAWAKNCSWCRGCALQQHLGVSFQLPVDPATGQCDSASRSYPCLMQAKSFWV